MKPIQIVQGGQYGSEAKGLIAAYLVNRDGIDIAVRTGATNAGHTCVYADAAGKTHRVAMQQIPVGWVRPATKLVLGAGALVDLEILEREIQVVNGITGTDIRDRLYVDPRAYIHRAVHHDRSHSANRHHLIGATGKGCSEALLDRVRLRGMEDWTIGGVMESGAVKEGVLMGINLTDTEQYLNRAWNEGASIQLEGTQGQLLDLYLGPYPYTTHKQTGPAQWMAEAGLSPSLPVEIWAVMRTYPIRVAGNSGPLPNEISWPILAREINRKRADKGLSPIVDETAIAEFENAVRAVAATWAGGPSFPTGSNGLDQHIWADRQRYRNALSEVNKQALASLPDRVTAELMKLFEMTTVTKKLRRIARISTLDVARSCRQIRPYNIALTFVNYEFPERWCTHDSPTDEELRYLFALEKAVNARIGLINRGPDPSHIIEVR